MRSLTEILENKPGSSEEEIINRYRARLSEPKIKYCRDFFSDVMEDDNGNDFNVLVTYHYYEVDDFYQGPVKRIVEYNAARIGDNVMSNESFNESLQELIRLHERNVVFEVGMYTEI